MKRKYGVATFLLFLQLASETTAVITTCPAASLSVSTSPSKYYCDKTPSYAVVTDVYYVDTATAASGTVTITPDNKLELSTVTQCGAAATAPVTCGSVEVTFGTADAQDDGSKIAIGDMEFDGLAHWSCEDAASPTPSEFNYYFFIKVDTPNTHSYAASTITQVNNALTGNSVVGISMDASLFEEFDRVDDKTQIYFFKESDTASHTVFYSDETLIKFSTTQFNKIINGASPPLSPQTPAGICNDAVLFCFDENEAGCKKSGSAAPLGGTMMMLIPTIFTQFYV